MSRWIDADALIEELKNLRIDNIALNGKSIVDIINEQPTAYDVRKVVIELDRMRDDSFHKCDGGITYNAYTMAIKIVEKGGVK